MEQLLASFPTTEIRQDNFRSFVFQPDKISINSFQDKNISPNQLSPYQQQTYSAFTNILPHPALHVKSLQLNRATIPLPMTSIPNNECIFLYRTTGTFNGGPAYNNLKSWQSIRMVRLLRTDMFSENDPAFYDNDNTPANFGFNKVFTGYQDIVDALNKAAVNDPITLYANYQSFYVPGNVKFAYDEVQNKIVFIPQMAFNYDGTIGEYYTEIGYDDPDIPVFLQQAEQTLGLTPGELTDFYQPLNVRLGFTWNGILDKNDEMFPTLITYRMRPIPDTQIINYYAQAYANLVHTHNIFIYADIVGGSSEDTNSDLPLLAVIPVSTAQLGVNTFEVKTMNPLTKVPNHINAITIQMRTDTNSEFVLPNSAPVNLEISLFY